MTEPNLIDDIKATRSRMRTYKRQPFVPPAGWVNLAGYWFPSELVAYIGGPDAQKAA